MGGLVSFSADVIKYFDKINLRENGCIPAHISRVESTVAWTAGQHETGHSASVVRRHEQWIHACWHSLLSPPFIQFRIPPMVHTGLPVSINVIKVLLPRQAQRAISEVILESVKLVALTVMGINILSENR